MSAYDPADLLLGHESRAVTFENPTGARGAGGTAANGRKGVPNRILTPGQRVVLADLTGPGRVTHVWLTTEPQSVPRLDVAVATADLAGIPAGHLPIRR